MADEVKKPELYLTEKQVVMLFNVLTQCINLTQEDTPDLSKVRDRLYFAQSVLVRPLIQE